MNPISQETLHKAALFSLSFLWLFTGLTSIFFSPDVGYQILASANIAGTLADIAVLGGGALDIALGLWLLTSIKTKLCCLLQIAVIIFYTLLLTFIDASFWIHPFAPIIKNIPIIVLTIFVYKNSNQTMEID